jgi:hypothetical protein
MLIANASPVVTRCRAPLVLLALVTALAPAALHMLVPARLMLAVREVTFRAVFHHDHDVARDRSLGDRASATPRRALWRLERRTLAIPVDGQTDQLSADVS